MPIKFAQPKLYAEHLPEVHRTVASNHTVTEETLPGFVSVGVILNGVKKELTRFKAGGLLDDLRRAEQTPADESGDTTDEE